MVFCLGLGGVVFCPVLHCGKNWRRNDPLAGLAGLLWLLHECFDMTHGGLPFSRYDGGFGGVPDAAPISGLFAPC
jgi:hypothetical protein